MVQTGAYNKDARQYKLPETLIGDAARFVACHEVGHSLGLRHNMIASNAYPTDSLRSREFTDRVGGTAASIMDYARFNYIAQPGDNIRMISPQIGPYDLMAIEWGYRWFPEEKDATAKLNDFLKKHTSKEYRYSETQSQRTFIFGCAADPCIAVPGSTDCESAGCGMPALLPGSSGKMISAASCGINFGSVVMIVFPAADCGNSSIVRSRACSSSINGSTIRSINRLINVDFPVRTGPTTPM